MRHLHKVTTGRRVWHALLTAVGAAFLTLAFFLVLPFIQTITEAATTDLIVTRVDTASLPPPPPPPPEEEEKKEEPEEEKPPELVEAPQPLDLAQLELALSPSFGDGWAGADMSLHLDVRGGKSEEVADLFALADLDQQPRAVYQPMPVLDAQVRKKGAGTVRVLFIVDQNGRVQSPVVQSSTDAVFERPALAAVKQWKFEPGKKNGKAVRSRMRVPITFGG